MTEISKADLIRIDAKIQERKTDHLKTDTRTSFEDQLMETVKQLENMGTEINEMMKSNDLSVKSVAQAALNVNQVAKNATDNITENIASGGKTPVKSAKSVTDHYAAMKQNKS